MPDTRIDTITQQDIGPVIENVDVSNQIQASVCVCVCVHARAREREKKRERELKKSLLKLPVLWNF